MGGRMSDHRKSTSQHMIAALEMLGAGPAGAPHDPVQNALRRLHEAAVSGRSEPVAPLCGSDRSVGDQLRRLRRENQLMIDQLERLAFALGACPNCWGSIPDCEDCGGIGEPGAFSPDGDCFTSFVLPVILRFLGEATADSMVASRDGTIDLPDPNHPQDTPV